MLTNLENKILWMIGYVDYEAFDFNSKLHLIKSYNQIRYHNEKLQNNFMLNGKIKDNSLFLVELDNKSYYDLLSNKNNFLPNPQSYAEKNISQLINFNPSYVIPYAFKTNDFFKNCPWFEKVAKRRKLIKEYFISFLSDINDNFETNSYSDIVCLSGKIHAYDYMRPDFIKKNLKGLIMNLAYF
ncbi:MAG: hypothetical protein WC376_04210 [Candidatus Nanoarchaeia archaeon]|jgi:hypothetical protein